MIKKIKSKLAVKVFIISALLMAFCCGITYFFILHFAPYIYSYTPSDVEWFADELAQELSMTDKGETAIYFSIANDRLTGDYNNEYLFHLFNSDGEEVSLTDTATATGKQIDDYNPKETSAHYTVSFIGEERPYTLLLAKNTDKESQAVEALHKALPALTIVIVAISVLAAVFYAWYMTAPIKKISKMSKQMANMDFGSLCPVERTDEIGVLSDSLNTLSSNLSAALTELKDANQKLQADIDKERELELQRIKFFSAASHELKTPITIIKGQLQGMLCGVGRYKDRETYLAQSLEVTNSLEKMVQELLTVSRIEAPQYSCVKTHFDFTQFLRQRLAAFDDLFVQKELSVAINLLPGIYIDGDIGLLQKVVDNLLGNAATYSPPGNSVRVDLRQAEEKVYLTIKTEKVLTMFFVLAVFLFGGATVASAIQQDDLLPPIGFSIFFIVSLIGSLNMIMWKLEVNGDEITWRSTFGRKRTFHFEDITYCERKKGSMRVYVNGEKLFTIDSNIDKEEFMEDIKRRRIPVKSYWANQHKKNRK